MELDRIFRETLDPVNAIGWRLGKVVAECHPGKFVLAGVERPFDIEEFASEGQCEAHLVPEAHAELETVWRRRHGLGQSVTNGVWDVRWQGQPFRVVVTSWRNGYDSRAPSFVIANDEASARELATAVSAYCNDPRRAVLCFRGGCWNPNHELWSDIQAASFDDLVLAGDLKERIRGDLERFMGARAEYERYGLPHKRGVLFVGPPGNGKTHCVRATLKMLGLPVLYVMSLKAPYATEDASIDRIFARAREVAPCVLVFEDLDAMINDQNRSYFLNQLDGVGRLSGTLTLATTNHADRLDPAIVERPSRFDRKYAFALPGPTERRTYARQWNARLDAAMRIDDDALEALIRATDDFSFAYLKELFVSSMVRWVSAAQREPMKDVLTSELATLREQMRAGAPAQESPVQAAEDAD
jgi:hypothetical protein